MTTTDGGFLIPPYGSPAVSRKLSEVYHDGPVNNVYDLGVEKELMVLPTLPLRNEATVAQKVIFEIDARSRQHTFLDFSSVFLHGSLKIVDSANNNGKPANTVNASTINNCLLSTFTKLEFKINGVGLDEVDDWPHVNQIDAVFNTNKDLRAGVLREGGMVLDTEGAFNSCNPDVVAGATNVGYTARQANFAKANHGEDNWTFDYKETGHDFQTPMRLPLNRMLPGAGSIFQIEMTYSSNNWQHYIMANKSEEGKRLKPWMTNLYLTIKTYVVDSPSAALQMERRLRQSGIIFHYNTLRTDRFLLQAGSKTYKTLLINQGEPFLYAFVTLSTADAVEGDVTKNPFEYLLTKINRDKTNDVTSIVAKQNQKELNSYTLKNTLRTDYSRTARLARVYGPQQKSYYDTTFNQFQLGYGIQLFSCALVQSDISSPAGRIGAGPVEFEFNFEKILDQNLVAKFCFITPKVFLMHQADGPNAPTKISHRTSL